MTELVLEAVEAEIRALVTARSSNLGLEVTMPVLFPDGENATVIVASSGPELLVHDAGGAAMSVELAGCRLTSVVMERLRRLVTRYGCDLISGRVERTCSPDQVALACVVVANASRAVADHVLALRPYPDPAFDRRVTDLLREVVARRLRENQQVSGRGGRAYKVAHVVLDEREALPVAFVVPIPARADVAASFAELYDLKQSHPDVDNEAIYDEHSDIRVEEQLLLAEVSIASPFRLARHRLLALIGQTVGAH